MKIENIPENYFLYFNRKYHNFVASIKNSSLFDISLQLLKEEIFDLEKVLQQIFHSMIFQWFFEATMEI